MPNQSRQLAAIMFTDIVGYTALMGEDENQALALLRKNRNLHKSIIKKHHGKWLKEMGDGTLASFKTTSDAVYCAGELMKACKTEDITLRIGIHQGEIVEEDGDVFGDGVNIASRLELLAPVGGIYISESVFRNIQNKEGIKAEFVREESLKNVKIPVRIYNVKVISELASTIPSQNTYYNTLNYLKLTRVKNNLFVLLTFCIIVLIAYVIFIKSSVEETKLSGPNADQKEISIAVLPFKNFSGDQELEPFCYGMTLAVISRLTKLEGINKVIPMTSAMTYKQTEKTMPQIAEELDVTHILDATFQKSGKQIKITLQLIDGPSDNHYWANEYTGVWGDGDIFEIEARVSENVARSLGAQISDKEIEIIRKVPTENEEAYEIWLNARWGYFDVWGEAPLDMKVLLEKAISLDSNFIPPYVDLGYYWLSQAVWDANPSVDYVYCIKKANENIQYAISMDPENGDAYIMFGALKLYFELDLNQTRELMTKGLELNPTSDNKQIMANTILPALGEYEYALSLIREAIIEAPADAGIWSGKALNEYLSGDQTKSRNTLEENMHLIRKGNGLNTAARIYFGMKEYQKVIDVLNIYLDEYPDKRPSRVLGYLAVANYHLDNTDTFHDLLDELKQQAANSPIGSPSFHIAFLYAQSGEFDAAFEWLEKAFKDREVEMYWLNVEPPFEPLYDDPRWQDMLDKVGFPK